MPRDKILEHDRLAETRAEFCAERTLRQELFHPAMLAVFQQAGLLAHCPWEWIALQMLQYVNYALMDARIKPFRERLVMMHFVAFFLVLSIRFLLFAFPCAFESLILSLLHYCVHFSARATKSWLNSTSRCCKVLGW